MKVRGVETNQSTPTKEIGRLGSRFRELWRRQVKLWAMLFGTVPMPARFDNQVLRRTPPLKMLGHKGLWLQIQVLPFSWIWQGMAVPELQFTCHEPRSIFTTPQARGLVMTLEEPFLELSLLSSRLQLLRIRTLRLGQLQIMRGLSFLLTTNRTKEGLYL